MSKSLYRLSILLLLAHLSKADEEKITGPPIDQDFPLVLMNTDTKEGIRLPTEVEIALKKTGLFGEKKKIIQFSIWYYYNQEFYCPPENDEQRSKIANAIKMQNTVKDSMKEKIDDHCLIKQPQGDLIPAPGMPRCQKQPQPKIMKVFNENLKTSMENNEAFSNSGEISCSASGEGKLLGVGYQVCIEYEGWGKIWKLFKKNAEVHPLKNTKELLFYNLCYGAGTSEILFTKNTIRGRSLFTDPLLEKDRKKTWPIDTYNSIHIPNMKFEQVKLKFEQVEKVSDFRIQLLVHPDDFAMGLWKKPAYHFANASLIHEDLQQCWNSMHLKIQEHIWETPKYLDWNYIDIFTGAFKLPETGTLKTITDVEIPKIWVKLLYNRYSVAIIANNYRDDAVDEIISEKFNCKENLCEKFLEENCPNIRDHIRCCALTDEIQALFGTKFQPSNIRRIKGLVVVKPKEVDVASGGGAYRSSNNGPSGTYWGPSLGMDAYAFGAGGGFSGGGYGGGGSLF